MGDRCLIQVVSKESISPVLYLHWCGGAETVAPLLARVKATMAGRRSDVEYTFARLTAAACALTPGNLSVGVNPAPLDDTSRMPRAISTGDSHGDAGCVVVHIPEWRVVTSGGYLKPRHLMGALTDVE